MDELAVPKTKSFGGGQSNANPQYVREPFQIRPVKCHLSQYKFGILNYTCAFVFNAKLLLPLTICSC